MPPPNQNPPTPPQTPPAVDPKDKEKRDASALVLPRRVRAKADGFYAGQRIRKGKVFTIKNPKDFSGRWMVYVSDSAVDEIAAVYAPKRKRPGEQPADQPPTSNAPSRNRAEAATGASTEVI